MEERIKKAGSVIFYLTLLIELGIVIVDKSAYINPIEGQLFRLTFALCALKIAMTKYSLKEWLVMAAFLALGAISYFATERNEIIRIVAFVAAAKDINLKNVMKITFYVTLAGVVCLMGLSIFGIFGNMTIVDGNFRGAGAPLERYCIGLGHPNALHCMFWALATLGIYLYFERLKWYHLLILEAANIGLYLLTMSRTGMISVTLTILSALILILAPSLKEKRWIYVVGGLTVLVCVIFSLFAAKYGYYPGPLSWTDRFLTGRVRFGYEYGNMSMWSLFSVPENTTYFDMGFIRLFYWYGFIPGAVFVLVNCLQVFWCYRKKDAAALLVIVLFAVYTVFEAHAVSVYLARNYVLLLLGGTWSEVFLLGQGTEGHFWQVKKLFQK